MPNGKLSPTFYYRFMVGKKRHTGSTGCTTAVEARKFERNLIGKLRQQTSAKALVENFRTELAGGHTILLSAAFQRFVEKPKRRLISPKQLQAKEGYWADFLAFMKARYPTVRHLSEVKRDMAEEYVSYIRATGRYDKAITYRQKGRRKAVSYALKGRKLSPRTCNVCHKTIQQVFQTLSHDAGLPENPFADIPKLPEVSEQREAFTPEELKLIGGKADDFIYPLFAIAINTGLREGDVCTLKWSEVDLRAGWIKKKTAKTGKEVDIPILPPLRSYLQTIKRSADGNGYVLPAHAEMHRDNPSGVSYRIKRFLEDDAVGIETSRQPKGRSRRVSVRDLHSCRHTFCYLAAIHGVPFPIVKDIVGHVDSRITEMYMNHASREAKQESLRGLPNYLGLPEPEPPGQSPEEQVLELLELMTEDNLSAWPSLRDRALQVMHAARERAAVSP